MIKRLLVSISLACVMVNIQAQIPDDIVRLDVSDIEGARITQERTYTKESLFGYMNGGAELYLEYGFEKLLVTDIKISGKDLKIEAYKMPSADMAFGIYSVNIFRCGDSDPLCDYYCQSDYQIQFHKGLYYVNIINSSGSGEGLKSGRELAGYLIDKIGNEQFDLNDFLQADEMPVNIEKLMLVAGEVAVNNYAFEYLSYLDTYSDYILLVVKHEKGTVLVIRTEDDEDHLVNIDDK